ncbi:MAG TPA: hypothetical protein VL156_02125 [Terriglobales bacterium]|nr:hypothetical protein [Terriglobales bacterium]
MGFRFEFDPANKILMTRMEGELTDDLVREADVGIRKHLSESNPLIHIVECSSVTKFSMFAESVRYLARRERVLKGMNCRRFFVMPSTVGFGLARMFQIAGDPHYESVTIVRSLDEVRQMLNVGPFQFGALE